MSQILPKGRLTPGRMRAAQIRSKVEDVGIGLFFAGFFGVTGIGIGIGLFFDWLAGGGPPFLATAIVTPVGFIMLLPLVLWLVVTPFTKKLKSSYYWPDPSSYTLNSAPHDFANAWMRLSRENALQLAPLYYQAVRSMDAIFASSAGRDDHYRLLQRIAAEVKQVADAEDALEQAKRKVSLTPEDTSYIEGELEVAQSIANSLRKIAKDVESLR